MDVKKLFHILKFDGLEFARLLKNLVDPQMWRALDKIRKVKTWAELNMDNTDPW